MAYQGATVNSSTLFMISKESKAWKKHRRRFKWYMTWGMPAKAIERQNERKKDPSYDTKYAYILVGHTHKLAFVTPDRKRAFKTDGYYKTRMEWPKFRFIKWTTSMEL